MRGSFMPEALGRPQSKKLAFGIIHEPFRSAALTLIEKNLFCLVKKISEKSGVNRINFLLKLEGVKDPSLESILSLYSLKSVYLDFCSTNAYFRILNLITSPALKVYKNLKLRTISTQK